MVIMFTWRILANLIVCLSELITVREGGGGDREEENGEKEEKGGTFSQQEGPRVVIDGHNRREGEEGRERREARLISKLELIRGTLRTIHLLNHEEDVYIVDEEGG